MTIELQPFDPADYLQTPEDIAIYLRMCLEDNDDLLLAQALGDIARSKGMSELAATTGLSREALYRSLSADGNPNLSTLIKVCDALGVRLTVTAA